jgi:phage terminase small subunit
MVDLNATNAALRAGYGPAGAKVTGCRMLKYPDVAAAIQAAMEARAARIGVDQDWVLKRLVMLADSDIRRIFSNREMRDPATMDDETAYAVSSIKFATARSSGTGQIEHTAEIKLTDKLPALQLLGKHLGMFRDKVDVEHSGGVTVVLSPDESAL